MFRLQCTATLVLTALVLGSFSACSADDATRVVHSLQAGSVRIPLVTSTAQATYRLQGARFALAGPVERVLTAPEDATSLIEDLPIGDYTLELEAGWTLTRLVAGAPVPVEGARLVSDNPLAFSVRDQEQLQLLFVFDVSGQIIEIGQGRIEVGIAVVGEQPLDPCAAGTVDVDGDPATGAGGCECLITDAEDPLDPGLVDANCDGTDGVAAACVFVSRSRGNDAGTGSLTQPLATIARAIQVASASTQTRVCLSAETYDESVTLVDGISLYGGFDAADVELPFRRRADAVSVIRAPGTGVLARDLTLPTELQLLRIVATMPGEADGSTYGVRVDGGALSLVASEVIAERGRAGAAGADGAAAAAPAASGLPGQAGCNNCAGQGLGGNAPVCAVPGGRGGNGGFDTAGQAGGGPNGGPGGAAAAQCLSPAAAGGNGGNGLAGTTGVAGNGGASVGGFGERYVPAAGGNGSPGSAGQSGGGGGGGGGGIELFIVCNADRGGGGGSGGCGGTGGLPGAGGEGGGASFAVYATRGAILTLGDVQLTTLGGGAGGPGGLGGAGQSGGNGGPGGAAAGDAGAGGPGGRGGGGGAGGPGGGGGGGPTACIARQASVSISGDSSCTLGPAGAGGLTAAGPAGAAGAVSPELVR